MSVLTVSGSTGLLDPNRPVDYPRTTTFSVQSTVPLRADNINTYSYTRSAAVNSQPGLPTSNRNSRTDLPATPHHYETSLHNPSPLINRPVHSSSGFPLPQGHSRQSSTNTFNMQRQATTASAVSATPRRSTSSRSTNTNSPTSYVALMRKQKATVWCDRSQNLDPRLAHAQRVAKHRAALEVAGSVSGRTSTISSAGVTGKIRHGGPRVSGYSPANIVGANLPVRLSANETLGDDEEDAQSYGDNAMLHGRSGSGKSSASSAKYRSGYPRQESGRFSGINTPPSGEVSPGKEGIPELNEAEHDKQELDYKLKRDSEDSFGGVGDLQGPSALKQAVSEAQKAEDLRRRGSVDERAMSMRMGGVRLYIANPDLDDD